MTTNKHGQINMESNSTVEPATTEHAGDELILDEYIPKKIKLFENFTILLTIRAKTRIFNDNCYFKCTKIIRNNQSNSIKGVVL